MQLLRLRIDHTPSGAHFAHCRLLMLVVNFEAFVLVRVKVYTTLSKKYRIMKRKKSENLY